MLIYRTLLIEHCHNGGCDHRARITHPRKNAITLAQVSAGTREDCIRKAIAEVDQLFQQKRLQRQRLQQRRHQLHTQLQAVLARQLPMPTLLASFKHLTTRQQAHVRDKLFNAALAGAPLHLPPVMQLDPEQRRCLASVRYKGHGRLLREPLLSHSAAVTVMPAGHTWIAKLNCSAAPANGCSAVAAHVAVSITAHTADKLANPHRNRLSVDDGSNSTNKQEIHHEHVPPATKQVPGHHSQRRRYGWCR